MNRLLILLAAALNTACTTASCCLTTADESSDAIHYVVIGFGIVSIPKPKAPDGVMAANMNALGLAVSNQPGLNIGLGYSSSSVVSIAAEAKNAVVEVRMCRGSDGISVNSNLNPH